MRPGFEMDHIGIAVESIEAALPFYRSMGWSDMELEEVPTEQVRVAFIKFENRVNIELLESTSEEGVIAKFVKKRGSGIHHICFRVKNIENVVSQLKKEGIRLINETPKPGAHNCKVVFIHPSSAGGVLIELSEKQGGH